MFLFLANSLFSSFFLELKKNELNTVSLVVGTCHLREKIQCPGPRNVSYCRSPTGEKWWLCDFSSGSPSFLLCLVASAETAFGGRAETPQEAGTGDKSPRHRAGCEDTGPFLGGAGSFSGEARRPGQRPRPVSTEKSVAEPTALQMSLSRHSGQSLWQKDFRSQRTHTCPWRPQRGGNTRDSARGCIALQVVWRGLPSGCSVTPAI